MNSDLINETYVKNKSDEESLETNIKFNLGKLKISPFISSNIYQLDATFPNENYTPIIKYIPGKRGRLELESQKLNTGMASSFNVSNILDFFNKDKKDDAVSSYSNKWNLKLTRELPMELSIKGGASEQDIELGGIKLTYLRLLTGASNTTLSFSDVNPEKSDMKIQTGAASFIAKGLNNANINELIFEGGVGKSILEFSGESIKYNTMVEIKGGLGIIELHIAKDTGALIRAKNKQLLLFVDASNSFTSNDDIFRNSAYQEGAPHLNINVEMALSQLKIVEI